MYDDGPDVAIELQATLTVEAKRAAIRAGYAPLDEIRARFTPQDDLWERAAALELPLGSASLIELPVNRRWHAEVRHQGPEEWSGQSPTPLEVWPCPVVVTEWGAADPIEVFPLNDQELLEAEEQHQASWRKQVTSLERRVHRLLPNWRNWLLAFAQHCEQYWDRWTVGGTGVTPEGEARADHPAMVAFRKGYEALDPDAPTAAAQAEELFQLTLQALDVAHAWSQEEESGKRQRTAARAAEQWVRNHGSSRLKKALQLGLLEQSLGAYRQERLEAEHPGWRWVAPGDATRLGTIQDPSEQALDALAAARQWSESAALHWYEGVGVEDPAGPVVVADFLEGRVMAPAGPVG